MRTSVAAASLAAIFAAISLQNFAVAENLVVNGGFETLPPLNDWAVIYGLTTGLGLDAFPHSGLYSAEFYATRGTRDSLEQVLPTNPGVTYEVSFWLANFYNNPQQDNDFTVLWDGTPHVALVNVPFSPYTEYTFTVQAIGLQSALRFTGRNQPGALNLDDVSVVAIPEPSSFALAALGLLTLGMRRRR